MKARVNTFLNIRTGSPEILSNNNPNDLFFKPGDVIEIAETVKGEEHKKNNIWYKLTDGAFVWSGGVDKPNIEISGLAARSFASVTSLPEFDPNKMSWAHDSVENGGLGIVDIWKDARIAGEKVKVAILDEGFDEKHDDLKTATVENFSTASDQIEHGTEMLGIIGANGIVVYGVAPKCEMIFAKVDLGDADSIMKALRWAQENEADIISLSFKCGFDQRIEIELENCFNQNIAVIAAIGDSGILNKPINIYPASSPFCFGIGCFGKDFKRIADISNISDNIKLMAPAESILTDKAGNDSEEINGATSLATAFTSGTVALLLSAERNRNKSTTGKDVIGILCQHADKRNNEDNERTTKYGFGLIDPFQTYKVIKRKV